MASAQSEGAATAKEQQMDKRREMFRHAMNNEWEQVVNIYSEDQQIRGAKFSGSHETILHIAVYDGKTDAVKKLVAKSSPQVLEQTNVNGNTALHLAAALGMVDMCERMVSKHPDLINIRNFDGETPLFLSALHGRKNTFLCLHSKYPQPLPSMCCRRNDGTSILHVAILGEYFDAAFLITEKFPNCVSLVNDKGQTALHLLAANPSAFKSGCRFGRLERIIYNCMMIDPADVELEANVIDDQDSTAECRCKYPKNYGICVEFFLLLKNISNVIVPKQCWRWRTCSHERDAENPQDESSGPTATATATATATVESTRELQGSASEAKQQSKKRHPFPPNYITFFSFLELILVLLLVLGFGVIRIHKIREKKRKHTLSFQIMEKLVQAASTWEHDATGSVPEHSHSMALGMNKPPEEEEEDEVAQNNQIEEHPSQVKRDSSENNQVESKVGKKEEGPEPMGLTEMMQKILNVYPASEHELRHFGKRALVMRTDNTHPRTHKIIMDMAFEKEDDLVMKETPVLIAARTGAREVVEKILGIIPVAIEDVDRDGKNALLLAVENRHPHVYKFLQKKYATRDSVFQKVDKDGNSAMHLAATLGYNRPWRIPGAALQMQWEIKWYKFVKNSMPRHFFSRHNFKGQTPKEVFTETHTDLVKDGGTWLTNTSQSCSVVAALIATVAFATATTVPGGVRQTGFPALEGRPAFDVFAICSLIALCFSVTSLTMFLSILTSRYQEADFENSLPIKLIVGLTSLFVSIASMLVSFCAGHFFVLKHELKYAAFPVYAVTCLPITFFAAAQCPLYFDLIRSTITSVPKRTYEVTSL